MVEKSVIIEKGFMIIQGLKLTMLGMMVVFSFLGLLLLVMHLCVKLLKPYTQKEASLIASHKPSGFRKRVSPDTNLKLTAVISAAITAHRARLRRDRLP